MQLKIESRVKNGAAMLNNAMADAMQRIYTYGDSPRQEQQVCYAIDQLVWYLGVSAL